MERVLIEGVVEHGRRLGRELGFPTANLAVPEDVAAADGVYRGCRAAFGDAYFRLPRRTLRPSAAGRTARKDPRRTPVRFGGGTARADCQGQGIYFRIEIMCPYFGQKPGCVATSPSRGRGLGWGQTCKRGRAANNTGCKKCNRNKTNNARSCFYLRPSRRSANADGISWT